MPTIKFYPFSKESVDYAPAPEPASKSIPRWYRKQEGNKGDESMIPGTGTAASTVKRCMPVFDAMTAGYMLTAPCDIYIDATDPDKLDIQIPTRLHPYKADLFAKHSPEQYDHYPIDRAKHHPELLRILPTYSVGTEPGYSVLFTQPIHADKSPLFAIAGVIDTDKFISLGHVSFLVDKGFKGTIKQGTPLYQLIPFKREEWDSEVVDVDEARKITDKQSFQLRSVFVNGYKLKFRSKKEYK